MPSIRALWKGIKKEFLLVANQRTALLLVFLFPVIIIGTFGAVYSNTVNQNFSIAVFVDENNEKNDLDLNNALYYKADFIAELKKNPGLAVQTVSSKEEVQQMVLQNKVEAGLIVERPAPRDSYAIRTVLDTTDFVQSAILWNALSTSINTVSNQISTSILQKIWDKIVAQEETTNRQLQQIADFQQEFAQTRMQTAEIEQTVDTLEVGKIQQSIQIQRNKINGLRQTVLSLKQESSFSMAGFKNLEQRYGEILISQGRADWNGSTIAYHDGRDAATAMALGGFSQQYTRSMEQQEAYLNQADSSLALLDQQAAQIEEESAQSAAYVANFKKFLRQAKTLQGQIEKDLVESQKLLLEIRGTIQGVKQYSPQFLAKPATPLYEEAIQLPNYVSIFFPTVLAIVSLFTATLLMATSFVIEKKEGITSRLRSMPISKAFLLLQKIIGILGIVILELLILTGIGIVFFGVQLQGTIASLFASSVLTALCFIGIGILIGSLVHSESSAVMATLIVALPLIFLSGILLPIELMPQGFQILKVLNPLSTSITLLVNSTIKGLPMLYSTIEIISLAAIALAGTVIGYWKYF